MSRIKNQDLTPRPYLAVLGARFRVLLQYRAAAAAGFGCQLFWGLIRKMIFTAFFGSTTVGQPMTLEQTVTYVWLGQAFFGLIPFRIDHELEAMIHSGGVMYQMLRPVELYNLWLARTIANRVAPTLLKATPMVIVASIAGWIGAPTPAGLAAFIAALAAAALLAAAFNMLMSISMFWTLAGRGISTMVGGLLFVLSGLIVPLALMPHWLQPVLNALPFRGLVDVPFRLFTGSFPPRAAPALLAHQLAWTGAMIVLGRWLMSRAVRRLVVQGG